MSILDEVETEVWHILATIYTYQQQTAGLSGQTTRYDFANTLVARNALAEMVVIRTARLADRTRKVRNMEMLLKRVNFGERTKEVESAVQDFMVAVAPVVKKRHEEIAHMKPGTLSSYPVEPLAGETLEAVSKLVTAVDVARNNIVTYKYKVGSLEQVIDLRESLVAGKRVFLVEEQQVEN
ncbi:TPA: hypothetical protein RQJ37_004401 [Vibrio vulnificus]|uniref:hypothetical protein n=1 Tax=Vibrio sp. SCSIO 43136 TaxID=2819101 RepID=UPI002074C91E|nr:hypothetical protein [Vibrio sp. SCSIO 43136]HDY7443191.1 hypothetical protein [Vibrio vulnificus]USD64091.1 hypothetical protein J4N39_08150 [Vibrio sp. SCSIO 43136]USD66846.1 hypothetical protein J4N39_19535 [Vibrio sp. SCSIO 43136]HDY7901569.1 hypothetical protein [Vibrio vulnificus]HDY7942597.1 hypothetical protein [Vibrio vulnificus]